MSQDDFKDNVNIPVDPDLVKEYQVPETDFFERATDVRMRQNSANVAAWLLEQHYLLKMQELQNAMDLLKESPPKVG